MPASFPRPPPTQLLFRFSDHRGQEAIAAQIQPADAVDRAVAGFPWTRQVAFGTTGQHLPSLPLNHLTQKLGREANAGGAADAVGGALKAGTVGVEQAAELPHAQADGGFRLLQEVI